MIVDTTHVSTTFPISPQPQITDTSDAHCAQWSQHLRSSRQPRARHDARLNATRSIECVTGSCANANGKCVCFVSLSLSHPPHPSRHPTPTHFPTHILSHVTRFTTCTHNDTTETTTWNHFERDTQIVWYHRRRVQLRAIDGEAVPTRIDNTTKDQPECQSMDSCPGHKRVPHGTQR